MDIQKRLHDMGITLPKPADAVANYRPFVHLGNLISISGQLPMQNGALKYVGKVGVDISISEGQEAAKLCAINILAQLNKACDGDLNRVIGCLKLTGFVNASPGFKDHPQIIDGASNFIAHVLGDAGVHSRAAIGVDSLPMGTAVEVDGLFMVKS